MKRGYKRRAAALLTAVLVLVGTAAACSLEAPGTSSQEESSQGESSQEENAAQASGVRLENDGAGTHLVVAELFYSPERTQALEEIAEKYMADFPQTEIEIRTVESREDMAALLESGEQVDLCEVSWQDQVDYVERGWLRELSSYLEVWRETATLTPAARQAVYSLGEDSAYLLPSVINQDVLYYRSDWFDDYNEGLEEGLVYCRIWEDMDDTAEKLADRGAGLIFGGKDRLIDLFDSVLWSALNMGRMADPAAAYLSSVDGHDTVFTLEQAAAAVEQFVNVVESAVPEEALTWTEEEAVDAFIQGKAAMLLAGQDQMGAIASAMEEGTWEVVAYPRGITGLAITGLEFTGFALADATEHEENAAHFLTYLSNGDNNTHLAKACGLVPIHTTAADLDPSLEETGLAVNLLMVRRDWYYYAQEPVMYSAWEGWRDLANGALRDFLAGEQRQEELLAFMDEYWSQAREQEGDLWEPEERK